MNETPARNIPFPATWHLRAAGAAYLFVIVVGVLTTSFIDARLVVAGDATATARNVIAHETLFRVGILATLTMYVGVIVIAASLFVVLKTVDEGLARLAMLLRVSEAIIGAATTILALVALALLTTDALPHAESVPALAALLLFVRTAALDVVLVFVGIGGALFCYLVLKTALVPRSLAAWGVLTYVSMIALASVSIASPQHPVALETVLYSNGALFELVFGAWLLFSRQPT